MFYSITMVLLYSLFLLFYYFTVLPYALHLHVLSDREYSVFYQTEGIQCFIRQGIQWILKDKEKKHI